MNNKKLGTDFEEEFGEFAVQEGFWVHFITPNAAGQQPFDFIIAKDQAVFAVDCKTCARKVFPLSRLEDDQVMAFDLWIKRVRTMPILAVKHQGKMFFVRYDVLKEKRSVVLDENEQGVYLIYEDENEDFDGKHLCDAVLYKFL